MMDLTNIGNCGQIISLCVGIRDVLEEYPAGIKSVQEYVQNSEDAHATRICYIIDHRNVGPEIKGCEYSRGPSLIIFNDGIFSDEDVDNIINFKNSKKRNKMENVGKFGQGFNVSYRFGDYVEIFSNGFMLILDPHCEIKGSDSRHPGKKIEWYGKDREFAEKNMSSFEHLFEYFSLVGMKKEDFPSKKFRGSLIRIPLRTKERAEQSKILKEVFTTRSVMKMFLDLEEEFPYLLLFQNYLREIIVFEKREGEERNRLYECSVTMKENVYMNRKSFISRYVNALEERKRLEYQNHIFDFELRMNIISFDGAKSQRDFAISHTIDCNGSAYKGIRDMLLPLVSTCVEKNNTPFDNRVFVGNPIGSTTDLPFLLNGRFELTANRQNIVMDSSSKKSPWNRSLLDLVPNTYFRMLKFISEGGNKEFVGNYGNFLPQNCGRNEIDKLVNEKIVNGIFNEECSIFRNIEKGTLMKCSNVTLVEDQRFRWMKEILRLDMSCYSLVAKKTIDYLDKKLISYLSKSLFLEVIGRSKPRVVWKYLEKIWDYLDRIGIIHDNSVRELKIIPFCPFDNDSNEISLTSLKESNFVGKDFDQSLLRYFARHFAFKRINEKEVQKLPTNAKNLVLKEVLKNSRRVFTVIHEINMENWRYTESFESLNSEERKGFLKLIRTLDYIEHRETISKFPVYEDVTGKLYMADCNDMLLPKKVDITIQRKFQEYCKQNRVIVWEKEDLRIFSQLMTNRARLSPHEIFMEEPEFFNCLDEREKEEFMNCCLNGMKGRRNEIQEFFRVFRSIKCISTTLGWKTLRESFEESKFFKIFEKDGAYVKGGLKKYANYFRHCKEFSKIPMDVIVKCAKQIEEKKSFSRSRFLMEYLKNFFAEVSMHEYEEVAKRLKLLKNFAWIRCSKFGIFGTMTKDSSVLLKASADLSLKKFIHLCSSKLFVPMDISEKSAWKMIEFFGFDKCRANPKFIYNELLMISRYYKNLEIEKKGSHLSTMIPIVQEIYGIFSEMKKLPEWIKDDDEWIWCGSESGFCSKNAAAIERGKISEESEYFKFIPSDLYNTYQSVFDTFRVKKKFGEKDFVNVLVRLKKKYKDLPLIEKDLRISLDVLSEIASLKVQLGKKSRIFSPTADCRLVKLSKIYINDVSWLDTRDSRIKDTYFAHDSIPTSVLKRLGVKSKGRELYDAEKYMISVQRETYGVGITMETFVRDHLKNNPLGDSLFSEIIQNADDAGSTELTIMYNEKKFSSNKVEDGMKRFMGPALFIYSNSKFREEDFRGIRNPLKSVKYKDFAKTGRFGQGITCLFHVGDMWNLLSSNSVCSMDPLKILDDAEFTRIDFIKNKEFVRTFTDQFLPFQVFEEIDFSKEFEKTIFRIPCRTTKSGNLGISKDESFLKDKSFLKEDYMKIVKSFEKRANSCLLFLKNLSTLKIQVMNENGSIESLLEVRKYSKDDNYQSYVKEITHKRSLYQKSPFELEMAKSCSPKICDVKVKVRSYEKPEKNFDYVLSFGGMEKMFIESSELVPFASVACLMERQLEGRYFNSLVLPCKNTLPVHINGDFELESSRRGLWKSTDVTGSDGMKRAKWNMSVFENIVGECYIFLLEHLKSIENLDLRYYYSIFPNEIEDIFENEYTKTVVENVSRHVVENEFLLSLWNKHRYFTCKESRKLPVGLVDILRKFVERNETIAKIIHQSNVSNIPEFYYDRVKEFDGKDLLKILKKISVGLDGKFVEYSSTYISSKKELFQILKFLFHYFEKEKNCESYIPSESLKNQYLLPTNSNQLKILDNKSISYLNKPSWIENFNNLFVDQSNDVNFKELVGRRMDSCFQNLGVKKLNIWEIVNFKSMFEKMDNIYIKTGEFWKLYSIYRSSYHNEKGFKDLVKAFRKFLVLPVETRSGREFHTLEKIDRVLIKEARNEILNSLILGIGIPLLLLFDKETYPELSLDRMDFYEADDELLKIIGKSEELVHHINSGLSGEMKIRLRNFFARTSSNYAENEISTIKKLEIFKNIVGDFVKLGADKWRILGKKFPNIVIKGNYLQDFDGSGSCFSTLEVSELSVEELFDILFENEAKEFHDLDDKDQKRIMKYILFKDVEKEFIKKMKIIKTEEGNNLSVLDCLNPNIKLLELIFRDCDLLLSRRYTDDEDWLKILKDLGLKQTMTGKLLVRSIKKVLYLDFPKESNEKVEVLKELLSEVSKGWNEFSEKRRVEILDLSFIPAEQKRVVEYFRFDECCLKEKEGLVKDILPVVVFECEEMNEVLKKLFKEVTFDDVFGRFKLIQESKEKPKELIFPIYEYWKNLIDTEELEWGKIKEDNCIWVEGSFFHPMLTFLNDPHNQKIQTFKRVSEEMKDKYYGLLRFLGVREYLPKIGKDDDLMSFVEDLVGKDFSNYLHPKSKRRAKNWIKQCQRHIESAECLFIKGIYETSMFHSWTTVEQCLKAVCINDGTFENIDEIRHHLLIRKCPELLEKELEERVKVFEGRKYYIITRYVKGDDRVPCESFSKNDADNFLENAKVILSKCEKYVCS